MSALAAAQLRLLGRLPGRVQRWLRLAYVGAKVTADLESFRAFARLSAIEVHEGRRVPTVDLRLRPLGRRAMAVRPSTSDIDTVWSTFVRRYHLPPKEIGEPRLIFDLGANIGLTLADFAVRYPQARVVGVELDDVNAELACRNVEPWADRCVVVHAAARPEDGYAWYFPWPGGTATYRALGQAPDGATRVAAISVASLLREHAGDRPVDYLKMDIEGSEQDILRHDTGWASRVRSIKVEVHHPYSRAACEEDLIRLGFETRVDPRHFACVEGVRRTN